MRDLRVHTSVLSHIAGEMTILPAGFGVHLDWDELEQWLCDNHDALLAELKSFAGRVELKVQVRYTEEGAVQEVLGNQPALLKRSGRPTGMTARVAWGRSIAAAVEERAQRERSQILAGLSPLADQIREHRLGERGILSVSLLLSRERIAEVDRLLREIDSERGRSLTISCVGPLPPYSFVTPMLERGGSDGIA